MNMLLIPGLSVPTGASFFKIFITKISKLGAFFQNFYVVQNGDFYVSLLIQQTAFGFMNSLN